MATNTDTTTCSCGYKAAAPDTRTAREVLYDIEKTVHTLPQMASTIIYMSATEFTIEAPDIQWVGEALYDAAVKIQKGYSRLLELIDNDSQPTGREHAERKAT